MGDRLLDWPACLNARDVGGYATGEGRPTRWGALVRADSLCRLTDAGRAAVVGYGVRTIVDVQFPGEEKAPHPFRDHPAVAYLNVPVSAGRDPADDDAISRRFAAARTREEANRLEVDVNRPGFALIARAVARAAPSGVVVHCGSGKDRSGIAVALMLSAVGVPDDTIAEDYALSTERLKASYERQIAERRITDQDEMARLRQQLSSRPETMLDLLAHLRYRYGGAETYLRGGGLAAEEIEMLSRRLLG